MAANLIKRLHIVRSVTDNPFFNSAVEEILLRRYKFYHTSTLFLWCNAPNVVIGRNQNPYKECDLTQMNRERVQLVRRKSGGGTVYQDHGNANFSFISPLPMEVAKKANNEIILAALKRVGIKNAETSGRNDIVVNGRKISGSAFRSEHGRFLHHGTMMLSVKFDNLKRYLTPNKLKLQSKGISSVESRVANVSDIVGHDIGFMPWCFSLQCAFAAYYNVDDITRELVMEKDFENDKEFQTIMDERSSEKWRYGELCNFTHQMETRFSWGLINVELESKNGRIVDIKIYSDSLNPNLIDAISKELMNVNYEQTEIRITLENLKLRSDCSESTQIAEFSDWFINQI